MWCVIDGLHRDLTVASDARRGRFTHAGVTLELGRRPDWIGGGLTDDEEWRIEWVKLYEGLDLAHAAVATGERDYADAWQDLVESFCDQVPVGHDSSDVSARRLQNWIYAWQRLGDTPGAGRLRDGLADLIVERIVVDTDHLRHHLTAERNHRTMELYTLVLVGIALDDRGLAVEGLDLLADNAATDIGDDGVQRERSSDYHMIVLRSLLGAIANADAAALPVPVELRRRADLAATFGVQLQRPDGTTPALSDGDQADFRPLLALGARLLDRPDLAWAASGGRDGMPPSGGGTFPTGGYVVQRTGWRPGRDERWAILDCGPLGDGGHGHYDHLGVELAAGPVRIAVDPGRYTYADDGDDGWRHWFKGTAAHNTVCIDGLDQQPFRRGKPKGPQSTAWLVRRDVADGLDVAVARASSPRYGAVHTRALALVDDDYWVVVDHVVDPDDVPHEAVARWHLDIGTSVVCERTHHGLDLAVTTGATFAVVGGRPAVENGWISPAYGEKHPAPVVAIAAPVASASVIATVITPGARAPRTFGVERAGERWRATVAWPGHVDVVELTTSAVGTECDDPIDGPAVWWERRA